jgi:tetratricopeptide (TPR) repeat protein
MPDTSTTKSTLLENQILHVLIITAIALAAYSNTLQVPFLFDDEGSIQLNDLVHGLRNFFDGGYNFLPNRVVGYFTFALNYQFGELNVVGYHVVNLLIHIFSSLLVYTLIRATFRTPALENTLNVKQNAIFAFVVALIFVSHPIQTQAVTYIVQRVTSLATLFYLSALVCYVRWRLTRGTADSLLNTFRSPWYLLSLLSALLAMKTKEIAFTLPLIILLYEWFFFGKPGRKLLAQMVPLLLTITIIPYTVFITVSPVLTAGGSMLSDVNSPAYNIARITRWEYLLTQFSVILTYIRLMLLPTHQNLDYDYPISNSLAEPKVILSIIAIAAFFALAAYLYWLSRFKEQQANNTHLRLYRLASFGIFWFFITLSVESSIIVIRDVIFEHRLYLPSVGFIIAVTASVTLLTNRLQRYVHILPKVVMTVVIAVILLLSGGTYARNGVWNNWISIWSDTVAKSPNKPRAHNVLGIGYYYSFKFEEALREYRQAIIIKPDFIDAYYNMSLIYNARRQYTDTIRMYLTILSISAYDPEHFATIYNEMGITYAEMSVLDRSVAAFAEAVKHNPIKVEYRNNYAFALLSSGNKVASLREFSAVIALDPANSYAKDAILEIETQKTGGGKLTTNPLTIPGTKLPLH